MWRLRLQRRGPRALTLGAAGAGLLVVGAMGIRCRNAVGPVLFDAAVSDRLGAPNPSSRRWRLAETISSIATPTHQVVAGMVLTALVLLLTRDLWWTAIALLGPALTDLAGIGLKYLVYRSGPGVAGVSGVTGLSGADLLAYPSGHATGIGARVTVVVLLVGAACHRRWLRGAVLLAAVLVALAVGSSQAVIGAHFPVDVAGGLILGPAMTVLIAAAILRFARTVARRRERARA